MTERYKARSTGLNRPAVLMPQRVPTSNGFVEKTVAVDEGSVRPRFLDRLRLTMLCPFLGVGFKGEQFRDEWWLLSSWFKEVHGEDLLLQFTERGSV